MNQNEDIIIKDCICTWPDLLGFGSALRNSQNYHVLMTRTLK